MLQSNLGNSNLKERARNRFSKRRFDILKFSLRTRYYIHLFRKRQYFRVSTSFQNSSYSTYINKKVKDAGHDSKCTTDEKKISFKDIHVVGERRSRGTSSHVIRSTLFERILTIGEKETISNNRLLTSYDIQRNYGYTLRCRGSSDRNSTFKDKHFDQQRSGCSKFELPR